MKNSSLSFPVFNCQEKQVENIKDREQLQLCHENFSLGMQNWGAFEWHEKSKSEFSSDKLNWHPIFHLARINNYTNFWLLEKVSWKPSNRKSCGSNFWIRKRMKFKLQVSQKIRSELSKHWPTDMLERGRNFCVRNHIITSIATTFGTSNSTIGIGHGF